MEPSQNPHLEEPDSDEEPCSICLCPFKVPRTLPCIHSFCHRCLQQHITESHNLTTDTFLCPLCRRPNQPSRQSSLPVTLWASSYPINIFLKNKCANHSTPVDGICFCHEVHLCFHCLLQQHRNCCLSINPSRKTEIIAYFQEFFDRLTLWQSRLTKIRAKKNREYATYLAYINDSLFYLETLKRAILIDLRKITRHTLESDTLKLVSVDFGLTEYQLTYNLKPKPFSEFHLAKQFLIQSAESLVEHKLLADDKLIIGLVNEAKVFMISPLGRCLCEIELLGQLKSIDVFGNNLVIVLLKLSSKSALEGSCLQYLRCSDLRILSVNSYRFDRSYSQTVALSENKVVALYYENNWVIDVLQIEDNTVVKVERCVLGSGVHCFIYGYDSTHIMYTNNIEIYRVNIQDKSKVCLLPGNRARRNTIDRVLHLAADKSAIYFADILNASIYKMTETGKVITLFLREKNKDEKIHGFHFNARGHVLICLELPHDYMYRLYKGEDFVGWNEESESKNTS